MKLYYDKKSKDPTYFVQKGIRNGKKTTTTNVERIGKHSELLLLTSDPLQYAKDRVKELNEQEKRDSLSLKVVVDETTKVPHSSENVSKRKGKNVGYLYLQKVYQDLGIKQFFDELQKEYKITYNLNDVNRFITISRILYPSSKIRTCDHLNHFIEQPDIKYQHALRFLDILYEHKDEYIKHLYKGSTKVIKRNQNICFFDCTNYYFETKLEDDDFIEPSSKALVKGLLKYGVSKEHRPNPIVQMGLFIDGDGIPVSMCMNPGSDNETKCAIPLEKEIVKMYENKPFIYCADAGLGSFAIRKFNQMGGRAYIVTQSISKLSAPLKEAVLNDYDYKLLNTIDGENKKDSLCSVQFLKNIEKYVDETSGTISESYKKFGRAQVYKIIEAVNEVDLGLVKEKTLKNGKTIQVKDQAQMRCNIIITFSKAVYDYQMAVQNRKIAQAKQDECILDLKSIEKERELFGFYAVVTNLKDDPSDIIDIMEQRYQLEEYFRNQSTTFESRPLSFDTKEHLIANFYINYTAFLLLRLLEAKLNQNGNTFTTSEILETLQNLEVFLKQNVYYEAEYDAGNILNELEHIYHLGLDKLYYSVPNMNKKIKTLI